MTRIVANIIAWIILLATVAGLVTLALFVGSAVAQGSNCGPRETVVAGLAERYGETRQAIALTQRGTVMEVFANLETGTWSVTLSDVRGMTCMAAAGTAYEPVRETQGPEDDPT